MELDELQMIPALGHQNRHHNFLHICILACANASLQSYPDVTNYRNRFTFYEKSQFGAVIGNRCKNKRVYPFLFLLNLFFSDC